MLLLLACTHPHEAEPREDTAPNLESGFAGLDALGIKNFVLVHADTLRADRLPMYGADVDTLPASRERPWMTVNGYFAASSWTLPSTTSMLTSLDVPHHGLTHMTDQGEPNTAITAPTLAEHLHDNGFATFAACANSGLLNVEGVLDGFDAMTADDGPDESRHLAELAPVALDWLDTVPEGQPFFVYFQPLDTHGPYNPLDHLGTFSDPDAVPFDIDASEDDQVAQFAEAYDEALTDEARAAVVAQARHVYDETILVLDDGLEALRAGLDERGLLDETLIVLSGDHGETLAEDVYNIDLGHGGTVRPELTRVPLLFSHPRLASESVDCLGTNVDLGPTLVEALGLPPIDTDGQPLQGGCRDVVHAATFVNNSRANWPVELMATDGVGMLRWSCRRHAAIRHDLSVDPLGLVELERDETPGIEGLEGEMEAFYTEILDELGTDPCEVEE